MNIPRHEMKLSVKFDAVEVETLQYLDKCIENADYLEMDILQIAQFDLALEVLGKFSNIRVRKGKSYSKTMKVFQFLHLWKIANKWDFNVDEYYTIILKQISDKIHRSLSDWRIKMMCFLEEITSK